MNTVEEKIARLDGAIRGLLHSYNRHWIRFSLSNCEDITPSEVATSVWKAEEAVAECGENTLTKIERNKL